MREADRQLMAVARRQHGLLTRAQGRAAGLSGSAWGRRIEGGAFVKVHTGVIRLAGAPTSDAQRILAAVLAAGPGAMASHVAAAWLWGVVVVVGAIDVTVGDRRRSARLPGVRLHRPTVLDDLRPVRRHRVPTTSPLRTIADLGAVVAEAEVEAALQHLLTSGLLSAPAVHAVLERHGRHGRGGVGKLRAVLRRWEIGGTISDSTFEALVGALLAEHGCPRARFHHRIGRYEVDFAFPEARVAVEVDGWAHHGHRGAFESDRARDLELASCGWLVVRLTWWAVMNRPSTCFGQLRDVLDRRSAA